MSPQLCRLPQNTCASLSNCFQLQAMWQDAAIKGVPGMTSSALESFEVFFLFFFWGEGEWRFQQLQIIRVMCERGNLLSQMAVCHVGVCHLHQKKTKLREADCIIINEAIIYWTKYLQTQMGILKIKLIAAYILLRCKKAVECHFALFWRETNLK